MSEPIKPLEDLDPLRHLDTLDLLSSDPLSFSSDLDLDLDLEEIPRGARSGAEAAGSDSSAGHLHPLPVRVPTLTNSPGCAPVRSRGSAPEVLREAAASASLDGSNTSAASAASEASEAADSSDASTVAPRHSRGDRASQPIRRARAVRVDAWAVPASASWTRTRKTIRKVNRISRGTDWALPF